MAEARAEEPLMSVDMVGCARCLGDGHKAMLFEPLTHPIELENEPPLTHWALCPTNGEPILLRFDPKP